MATQLTSPSPAARSKSLQAVWGFIESAPAPSRKPDLQGFALSAGHEVGSSFSDQHALRILKRGISSRILSPLSDYLEVGKGELANILELDRTTALRRADKDQPLPRHCAESVLRLLELKEMASATFESEDDVLGWLRRPHPLLDGESPLEAASTSFGSRRVRDILISIKYGGVV